MGRLARFMHYWQYSIFLPVFSKPDMEPWKVIKVFVHQTILRHLCKLLKLHKCLNFAVPIITGFLPPNRKASVYRGEHFPREFHSLCLET